MRGKETVKCQLGLVWTHEMQWRDLPEPIQTQARVLLRKLLEQVLENGEGPEEAGDDA